VFAIQLVRVVAFVLAGLKKLTDRK
jgi:hypothetical protein